MTEPNDRDAEEDLQSPTAGEPYPWRNSGSDSDQDRGRESEPETSPTREENGRETPNPAQNSPPPREQVTDTDRGADRQSSQRVSKGREAGDRDGAGRVSPAVVENGGEKGNSEPDPEKPLQAKLILLVIGGLRKVWHAKILGLQWLIPRITGSTDAHEGLTGHFYPSNMVREDERVIYSGNPSRWRSPGPYIFAGFLLVASAVISIVVPLGYGEPLLDAVTPSILDLPVPDNWWYAPLLFVGIAILLLVYVVTNRASTWHVITDKRLLHRENVLDPDRTRLKLVDIKSIDSREPIPDRWFGIGHIDIYTASTGGKEVTLNAVRDADSVASLIDRTGYKRQESLRSNQSDEAERRSEQSPEQRQGAAHQRSGHGRPAGEGENPSAARTGASGEQHRQDNHGQRSHGHTQEGPSGDHPQERAARGGGESESYHGEMSDPFVGEGDSIEKQRPDHSLRDDLDDSTRRDD